MLYKTRKDQLSNEYVEKQKLMKKMYCPHCKIDRKPYITNDGILLGCTNCVLAEKISETQARIMGLRYIE